MVMMTNENLKAILPSEGIYENVWTITEKDNNATFKKLNIESPNTTFLVFQNSLMTSFNLPEEIGVLLNEARNCDGISVSESSESKCLLVVELKSSFNEKQSYKAYEQMVVGLLKFYEQTKSLESFSIYDYDIRFILGSHKIKESKRDQLLFMIQNERDLNNGKLPNLFKYKILPSLILDGKKVSIFGKLPVIENISLDDDIKEQKITIISCMSDTTVSPEASYLL